MNPDRLTYQGNGRVNRSKTLRQKAIRATRRALARLQWQVAA